MDKDSCCFSCEYEALCDRFRTDNESMHTDCKEGSSWVASPSFRTAYEEWMKKFDDGDVCSPCRLDPKDFDSLECYQIFGAKAESPSKKCKRCGKPHDLEIETRMGMLLFCLLKQGWELGRENASTTNR